MKTLFAIICLLLFTSFNYSQIQNCTATDTVATDGTETISCYQNYEFAVITLTLGASTDTILVEVGTNFKDSTAAQQEYGQVSVIDMYTGDDVDVITGNTTTNRKYFVRYGFAQKHIKLKAPTGENDNATVYVVEFY